MLKDYLLSDLKKSVQTLPKHSRGKIMKFYSALISFTVLAFILIINRDDTATCIKWLLAFIAGGVVDVVYCIDCVINKQEKQIKISKERLDK